MWLVLHLKMVSMFPLEVIIPRKLRISVTELKMLPILSLPVVILRMLFIAKLIFQLASEAFEPEHTSSSWTVASGFCGFALNFACWPFLYRSSSLQVCSTTILLASGLQSRVFPAAIALLLFSAGNIVIFLWKLHRMFPFLKSLLFYFMCN